MLTLTLTPITTAKVILNGNKEPLNMEDGHETYMGGNYNHGGSAAMTVGSSSINSTTHIDDIGTPLSPRTKFIDTCLREGLNPRPSIIVRRGMKKTLDLSHHGIGDKMGKILSECMLELPYLQAILLADNNLTDASLGPIVQSLVKMKSIIMVDLSDNVVGDVASNTLSTYLGTPGCPIEKLILLNAGVYCTVIATSLVLVLALVLKPTLKLATLTPKLFFLLLSLSVVLTNPTHTSLIFRSILYVCLCLFFYFYLCLCLCLCLYRCR